MKASNHPSLYFSLNPLKALKREPEEPVRQSPYLRAVLSAPKTAEGNGRVVKMGNSTMAAALRYIHKQKLH